MKKGFTLIELIVILAIIGILASIAWCSLKKAKSSMKNQEQVVEVGCYKVNDKKICSQ